MPSPAGNCRVKNPNIIGIIQSMIWFVCACRGSDVSGVIIFCWTHIEPPTSTGSAKLSGTGAYWTKSTRSIPANWLSSGTTARAGFHQ